MATTRQQFLALIAEADAGLAQDFASLAARMRARLLAADDRDGLVPPQRWAQLERDLSLLMLGYFSGAAFQPFALASDGTLVPLSEFLRRLWPAMQAATSLALAQQAAMLTRALPADLERLLRQAARSPFDAPGALPPAARALYAAYVPPQNVLRADNRALLDRVLNAAAETRRKSVLLLQQLLAEGRTARETADTLERFLTVGLKQRSQPYGSTGRFDALRLLTSETAFAFHRAGVMAASLNPLVTAVEVYVSPRHREVDDCDSIVAGNPYALEDCPIPPFHAHCLCGIRYLVSGRVRTTVEALRGSELTNVQGALSPDFAALLLRGR